MSEAKFTPGPWRFDAERYNLEVPQFLHGQEVHPFVILKTVKDWAPSEADARLISAAPDMYAALERIAFEPQGPADASTESVLNAVVEIARAALAKAVQK